MLLQQETPEVYRSGKFATKRFKIGNVPVIMMILRSRFYSDPIKALIQEIVSNARDAHRERGCSNVPIEIGLPSKLHAEFYIRDFGLGITPQRMYEIFICYGNSTKRLSNLQTGGYGIGAKSPFAYSDSFVIISITPEKQGMVKRRYVAYIDQSSEGELSLVSQELTNEPQGTTIVVPCKPNDEARFENVLKTVCLYWDVRPKVFKDGEPHDVQWVKNEQFVAENCTKPWFFGGHTSCILVDRIPYPLTLRKHDFADDIDMTEYEHLKNILSTNGLCLTYDVGEILIAANREEVDMSPATVAKIIGRVRNAIAEFCQQVGENIATIPDYWQACGAVAEILRWCSPTTRQYLASKIKWQGKPVLVFLPRIQGINYLTYQPSAGTAIEYGRQLPYTDIGPKMCCVFGDTTSQVTARIKSLMRQGYRAIISVKINHKSEHDGKANWQVFCQNNGLDIKPLSSIQPLQINNALKDAFGCVRGKADWVGLNLTSLNNTQWQSVVYCIGHAKGLFIHNTRIYKESTPDVLQAIENYLVITRKTSSIVCVVPPHLANQIKKDWLLLDDIWDDIQKFVQQNETLVAAIRQDVYAVQSQSIGHLSVELCNRLPVEHCVAVLGNLLNRLKKLDSGTRDLYKSLCRLGSHQQTPMAWISKMYQQETSCVEEVRSKYPILQHVNTYAMHDVQPLALQYVQLLDVQRQSAVKTATCPKNNKKKATTKV